MCVHHQFVFFFMLLLVDRGHTPPALSFYCKLFLSTTTDLLPGNSLFSILNHDGKHVDLAFISHPYRDLPAERIVTALSI